MILETASDFRITEFPDSYRLSVPQVSSLTIGLEPWALVIRMRDRELGRFGLFESRALISRLADQIGSNLYYEALNRGSNVSEDEMRERVRRAVAPIAEAQRRRLIQRADPIAVAVQRAVFKATGRGSTLAQDVRFYTNPWLVHDVLEYRAAAIAAAWCDNDLTPSDYSCEPGLHADIAGMTHKRRWRTTPNAAPAPDDDEDEFTRCQEALSDWRGLYSPTYESYRSLDRTLMSLPRRVPAYLACYLRRAILERPLLRPVELATTAMALNHLHRTTRREGRDPDAIPRRRAFLRLMHHATEAEIRRDMAYVGAHTRTTLVPEHADDVASFIRFLADYPEIHHGRLGGLTTKAIRWHRDCHDARVARAVAALGGADRRTAVPPIPLPAIEGVRFLATIGGVVEEGFRMNHCIAGYAGEAWDGSLFLVHVEHDGEHASVAVSDRGDVIESSGPRNTRNGAVHWARLVLSTWGHRLRGHLSRPSQPNSKETLGQI